MGCEDCAQSAWRNEVYFIPHRNTCMHALSGMVIGFAGGQSRWLGASYSMPRYIQWVPKWYRTRNLRHAKCAEKLGLYWNRTEVFVFMKETWNSGGGVIKESALPNSLRANLRNLLGRLNAIRGGLPGAYAGVLYPGARLGRHLSSLRYNLVHPLRHFWYI